MIEYVIEAKKSAKTAIKWVHKQTRSTLTVFPTNLGIKQRVTVTT